MKRILLMTSILAILLGTTLRAEWIPLEKGSQLNNAPVAPDVRIVSSDEHSLVMDIGISGFFLENNSNTLFRGEYYQTIDIQSDSKITKEGHPELPYFARTVAIPDDAEVKLEIISTGKVHTYENVFLNPAIKSWYEGDHQIKPDKNREIYDSNSPYPAVSAEVGKAYVFRDLRIARISVYPVKYLPSEKKLEVTSSIRVKLTYETGKGANSRTAPVRPISPTYGKIYRSFISNYDQILEARYNGIESGHDLMLCIMPDEFVESFTPYAEWKRQTGVDIHITSFSDIGANSQNPDIIKNHIADAYHNWEVPPTYVLIIGDDGIFPKKVISYPDYSFPYDNYFVEIDGDDHFPEMMIGRLTNQGDYRMRVILNKLQKYEQEPYIAETDWYKKGICCSNNLYPSQVETKRFAARVMLEDGGFTQVDTLMSDGEQGWNCSMDINTIKNALNEGRSYLNYRGEGWNSGWQASCYSFQTDDVSSLNNGEKFPFVTSIGCGVAMFDANFGNCFGEEFLQLGSITSPRGAIGFVGPTSNTHTTYNNRIDKGIYVGMFREGMDTPGQALLRGKTYMYNVFGDDFWVEYHYRVFVVLGDPSIHVWKDVPQEINVNHIEDMPVGYNEVEVTATYEGSGLPLDSALICITGENIFEIQYSDAQGKVKIGVETDEEQTLIVTVRKGDAIPHQTTIVTKNSDIHIGLDTIPFINDLNGNLDGLANPNENCSIEFSLKNWGDQTADNVEATLTSLNPFVQIITSDPVPFGNIESDKHSKGNVFNFFLLPEVSNSSIEFNLNITSGSKTWDYSYTYKVNTCDLYYDKFTVYDEGEELVNSRMDPGETVGLAIEVINYGTDFASDVRGILRTADPNITIIDSIAEYGLIDVEGIILNESSPFIIEIDEACPLQYEVPYILILMTQNGNYPYSDTNYITIPVAQPIPDDYTGPDDYGYYIYASTDTLYKQAPVYDWKEISGVGTEINIPWNSNGDYTETIDLPFDFKYYGIDYSELRVSTDGWIAFGNGDETAYYNRRLPFDDDINSMVAVFWDDLIRNSPEQDEEIFYYNDAANNRFVIEWNNMRHNIFADQNNNAKEDFQVILYDPEFYPTNTENGEIICQYKEIRKPESVTIGCENPDETTGLVYLYNSFYDATGNSISNEFAIKFTTVPPVSVFVSTEDPGSFAGENNAGLGIRKIFPNPFTDQTQIEYSLDKPGNISIKVLNIKGELVTNLYDDFQIDGEHSMSWSKQDHSGSVIKPGIYVLQLQTEQFVQSKKVVLIK
jgi:hypothetical protein